MRDGGARVTTWRYLLMELFAAVFVPGVVYLLFTALWKWRAKR